MNQNRLHEIQLRYTDDILEEACRRFGFVKDTLEELEGSAFVYEGPLDGRACILKITPGIHNRDEQIIGATAEQLLGEIDFIRYLDSNGVPVALPIASRAGNWVESILLDEHACFLAYAFEKVPGFMYPDADVVEFPEPALVEWGRLFGMMHKLSSRYQPSDPAWSRLGWEHDDLLDYQSLIPADQPLVWHRYEEMIAALNSLPRDPEVFGLIHGDLHHGNFFDDNGRLIVFDFDAAHHIWFIADIANALINCLPLPRSETVKRLEFAIHFLTHLMKGYAIEKAVDQAWLDRIPLFLKLCELLGYSYFHKYWDFSQLSERRQTVLAEVRRRIENNIPVVEFEPDDLQTIHPS